MEVFGCDVTTGLTLSLFNVVHDTYSHVWKLELGARGPVVVKALRYKPAGRGVDSRWYHWNFSFTYSFRSHYDPGVDSLSNRNEYHVYLLGAKRPVPKADNLTTILWRCHEIWEP
jgi:hypothetical protein